MKNTTIPPPTAPFTVCPRCHYPGHHPNAAAWGKKGGSAKVKKGFAVAGQPSTEARKLGWQKRKAKAEAKAKAPPAPTAQPPR